MKSAHHYVFLLLLLFGLGAISTHANGVAPTIAKKVLKSKKGKQAASNLIKKACKNGKKGCLGEAGKDIKKKAKDGLDKIKNKGAKKLPNNKQELGKAAKQEISKRSQAEKNTVKNIDPTARKNMLKVARKQCKGLTAKQCNKLVNQTMKSYKTPPTNVAKNSPRAKGSGGKGSDSRSSGNGGKGKSGNAKGSQGGKGKKGDRGATAADVASNGGGSGGNPPKPKTERVQRWMSEDELKATKKTGLVRGGKEGTHHVTNSANSDPKRARQRTSLPQKPEVLVTLDVPKGKFSKSSKVTSDFKMPGGGMERTATRNIPAKIVKVKRPKKVVPIMRQQYVNKVKGLKGKAKSMREKGHSSEEIARALHAERRAIGVRYKDLTPPDKLKEIRARNLKKYGDELGPSISYLRGRGKSWDEIIISAARPNGKDLDY